jgi:hypothetical protein
MRVRHHWFIGDIHGCYDALRALEDRLARASERAGAEPFFVSVGDLVDRGPQSRAVVEHFRKGQEAGTHAALMGNHEEMMLRCLHDAMPEMFEDVAMSPWVVVGDSYRKQGPRATWLSSRESSMLTRLMWLAQGGTPTLNAWGIDARRPDTWVLPEEDIAFLCNLPLVFECEHAVATHALVDAEALAVLQAAQALHEEGELEMSELLRDTVQGAMWSRSLPDEAPDARTHVSGHTPLRRVRRYTGRSLVRVDSGCYLGWRLSAWCPELDRSMSVAGQAVLPR